MIIYPDETAVSKSELKEGEPASRYIEIAFNSTLIRLSLEDAMWMAKKVIEKIAEFGQEGEPDK